MVLGSNIWIFKHIKYLVRLDIDYLQRLDKANESSTMFCVPNTYAQIEVTGNFSWAGLDVQWTVKPYGPFPTCTAQNTASSPLLAQDYIALYFFHFLFSLEFWNY